MQCNGKISELWACWVSSPFCHDWAMWPDHGAKGNYFPVFSKWQRIHNDQWPQRGIGNTLIYMAWLNLLLFQKNTFQITPDHFWSAGRYSNLESSFHLLRWFTEDLLCTRFSASYWGLKKKPIPRCFYNSMFYIFATWLEKQSIYNDFIISRWQSECGSNCAMDRSFSQSSCPWASKYTVNQP